MTAIQRFLLRILPCAWAEDLRAESMSWLVMCEACGHARSVWELGGIRWNARGHPRRLVLCPIYDKRGWHILRRAEGS